MAARLRRVRDTPWLRGLPREVAVLAAIAFCVALGFGIAAPAIPIYAVSFGVSALLAGAVVSVFALMRLVSSPGAGALVDRIGERRVLTTGLIIVALSSVLAGLARDYPQLLVLRGIGGIGSSMFTVSAMALTLKVVRPDQRGRAAGAFQGGFLLGGVAGPAVGGAVVAWSIRAPFFVYAATLAVAAWVSWRHLPAAAAAAAGSNGYPGSAAHAAAPPRLRAALHNRAYWAALAANLTNGLVTFGLRFSLVPLFVVEGLGSGPGLSGAAFLVAAATQALLLLPAGRLADMRGRRPAMVIGCSLTAAGMALLAVAGAPWPFLAAMATSGLAAAFMGSAPAATVGDVAGHAGKGSVIALFQMTADFGAIVGPLAAGALADSLGYAPAFAIGAAVALGALAAALVMPETLRRGSPQPEGAPQRETP
jgi:MFS family permease